MKRSEINWLLLSADEFIRERAFICRPCLFLTGKVEEFRQQLG